MLYFLKKTDDHNEDINAERFEEYMQHPSLKENISNPTKYAAKQLHMYNQRKLFHTRRRSRTAS